MNTPRAKPRKVAGAKRGTDAKTTASISVYTEEQDLAGSLLALIDDGAIADAKQIADAIPLDAFESEYADVLKAITTEIIEEIEPTILGTRNRLLAAGHALQSSEGLLLADAIERRQLVGKRAAVVARKVAGAIASRHHSRLAKTAAEAFAQSDGGPDAQAAMAAAMEKLQAPFGLETAKACPSITDFIAGWEKREKKPKVDTYFDWFNDATGGGLPVGGIVGLFAPPKTAKSALALQLVVGAMLRDPDLRVVWARGEMTPEDFSNRFIAVASCLMDECPRVRVWDAEERSPLAMQAAKRVIEIFGDRITYVPPPLTVEAITAEIVRTGSRVCVIDYLQKMELPNGSDNRTSDLDKIVGQVRDMTEAHDLATILISSMSMPTSGTGAHLGKLGRGTVEIGHSLEVGYEAIVENRDPKGNPVKDTKGRFDIRWRCAGARNIEPRDLVLKFEGRYMTYTAAEGAEVYSEFGEEAFA